MPLPRTQVLVKELCLRAGVTLSVRNSSDSGFPSSEGGSVSDELLAQLPDLLAGGPSSRVRAHVRVTPSNVERLAGHVRELCGLGFHHIALEPAHELDWSDDAVRAWADQHRRIGTWIVGRASAGKPVPNLEPWNEPPSAEVRGGTAIAASEVASRLARAKENATRPYTARPPLPAREGTSVHLTAALLAAAVATSAAVAACGNEVTVPGEGGDGGALNSSTLQPGVCAVQFDSGFGPGVCAVSIDAGADGGEAWVDSGISPGVCAVIIDSGIGPGVCMIELDAGYQAGVCPVAIDAGYTPGVCL